MTDGIVMWDTISNGQFPAGGAAYAAYVDGGIGDQPNYHYILGAFPGAQHLGIALHPGTDADALDVENGAASPADIPGWHRRQTARGISRPVIYASAGAMRAQILPALANAGIPLTATRLWSAHYTSNPHRCGPASCGIMPVEADGTQWTPNALGRDLDESLLLPGFFGPQTLPPDWTYGPPAALAATGGRTSVRLTWQPPAGYPTAPAAYRVWVYRGTIADKSTLVPAYPRDVTAGAAAGGGGGLTWEGGGLEQGRVYTAHVAAAGSAWSRMRPYGFAAVIFSTG